MRTLTVLGSTGSIGCSTLDVVRRHPERFRIAALCAHRQIDALAAQCIEFRPVLAVVGSAEGAAQLKATLAGAGLATQVAFGPDALREAASLPEVDSVMAAIVGAAGLMPTLAAVEAGKRVLLANKEALVMAGPIFVAAVRDHAAVLLPIDSEHNAVFQALPAGYAGSPAGAGIRRILLTASGGPFRQMPREQLATVTPEAACAHPNWVMGRKISVDSATMMNKGLEVIEAHYLFDAPAECIEVVIHPQSVIHSLVDYVDGSVIAQLGNPDMRTPIAHALAYPERVDSGVAPLDLFAVARLDFTPPDLTRFPCLRLAYDALRAGGTAPAVLNAANEVAVAAFLERRLAFTDIASVVAETMEQLSVRAVNTLAEVLAVDAEARRSAAQIAGKLAA